MKTDNANAERLEYVIKAKASYRTDVRAKTWEEKVESIARMRRGAAEQKRTSEPFTNITVTV